MEALLIAPALHSAIRAHLEATFPNEGGGFLLGTLHGQQAQVTQYRFEANTFATEEQYHRYLMQEGAFQAAEDAADAQGLTLLGYFHSHPDHPAIPSEFDRSHALPNFLYLIVSVRAGQAAESRLWRLAEDRSGFQELDLLEASDPLSQKEE